MLWGVIRAQQLFAVAELVLMSPQYAALGSVVLGSEQEAFWIMQAQ